jgi:sarcosine oxidase
VTTHVPRPRTTPPVTTDVEVLVAGLGAAGASALHALASRGVDVLGVDAHTPPHALGSSHGRSRIIRQAYFEHPRYVPLVQRAWAGWWALEAASGRTLLHETGGLMLGPADGTLVRGTLASARQHGLPHALLSRRELAERYPTWELPPSHVGVLEPRAGVLDPEAAIATLLDLAQAAGATVRTACPLTGWTPVGDRVRVQLGDEVLTARRLILALGPWMPAMLPALPLVVERNVLYWFAAAAPTAAFAPDRFPVFLHEHAPGRYWYGFPDTGHGVKVANHGGGEHTSAEGMRRTVGPDEVAAMVERVRTYLPGAAGPLRTAVACPYTHTPDGHFILGPHPRHPTVLLASPCSGHGFKFAPALGELLADLAQDVPLGPFGAFFAADRFGAT